MVRILFVIYTPFEGYLPKRMKEVAGKYGKMSDVGMITVTPSTYAEKLSGQKADTVHQIELHPDNTVDLQLIQEYYKNLPLLTNLVELIKVHNN